jgi:hypothetical protein
MRESTLPAQRSVQILTDTSIEGYLSFSDERTRASQVPNGLPGNPQAPGISASVPLPGDGKGTLFSLAFGQKFSEGSGCRRKSLT